MPDTTTTTMERIEKPLTSQERQAAERDVENRLFQTRQLRLRIQPFRFSKYTDGISEDLRDTLLSFPTSRTLTHIAREHGLDEGTRQAFGPLLWEIARKDVAFNRFPGELAKRAGLDEKTSRSVAYWISRRVLEKGKASFEKFDVSVIEWAKDARKISEEPLQQKPLYQTAKVPAAPREEKPTLFGEEAPLAAKPAVPLKEVLEERAAASPMPPRHTVARPEEIEKLLEKSILPKPPMPHSDVEPRIKGNVVDLSKQ